MVLKDKRTDKRTETHACDLISRQAAIDIVRDECRCGEQAELIEELEALPSAQPDTDEWCTDCKEYDRERHCCPRWTRVIRETLKDAQPERKTGKWIPVMNGRGGHCCNRCNDYAPSYMNGDEHLSDFCPFCGADMRGGQDGSD